MTEEQECKRDEGGSHQLDKMGTHVEPQNRGVVWDTAVTMMGEGGEEGREEKEWVGTMKML